MYIELCRFSYIFFSFFPVRARKRLRNVLTNMYRRRDKVHIYLFKHDTADQLIDIMTRLSILSETTKRKYDIDFFVVVEVREAINVPGYVLNSKILHLKEGFTFFCFAILKVILPWVGLVYFNCLMNNIIAH